jgi:hypothetical protein
VHRKLFAALAVLAMFVVPVPAFAQNGPATVRADASNGVYVWVDGSWRQIHLPSYGLGLHNVGPSGTDAGLVQSYDQRLDGAGVSGGVGVTLLDGTFGNAFGSNVRLALGVSYLRATSSQSAATGSFDSVVQLVDGTVIVRCNLPVACPISSRLDSEQRAWRTEGSLASDFHAGGITITPLIAVLGGTSRTLQTFSQQRDTTSYNASSTVEWTDWGAKFGLGATLPVMTGVTVGVSGNIGITHRNASLSANDSGNNGGAISTSVLNTSTITTALLTGAMVEVVARPSTGMTLRLFAGLDYDSRVPGIASPTFKPADLVSTVGTPAGLSFSGQTGYFAGAGLVARFGS